MDLAAESKTLVSEIFSLTGQKVETDDPIVVAALIHSQLIRRAGEDAMTAIQTAAGQAVADLTAAVSQERQAAAEMSQATKTAYQQIITAAKMATETETAKVEGQLVEAAKEVLNDVRKEAGTAAPSAWKVKVATSASIALVLAALAGGVVGSRFFPMTPTPTEWDIRVRAAGEDFLMIIPKLDKATMDRLDQLIGETRKAHKAKQ